MKQLTFMLIALMTLPIWAQDNVRKDAKITIYNSNFAVVGEVLQADFTKGVQTYTISDLPNSIIPESVKMNFAGSVIEKSYHYNLYSLPAILLKSIGKTITLTAENGVNLTGKLLSADGMQIVLLNADNKIIMLPKYDEYYITVPESMDGFSNKPYMTWLLNPEKQGLQSIGITYQTNNLNWSADYVLTLGEDEKSGSINAWANLSNSSGVSYQDAELSLVAGEVKKVTDSEAEYEIAPITRMNISSSKSNSDGYAFENEQVSDYYLLSLPRKITLVNNESKQISLFDANDVKIKKRYHIFSNAYNQPDVNLKADVILYFENKKSNNLGESFPNGIFRVYKKHGNKTIFLGEDLIKNTPENEVVEVEIGKAFDLVAKETVLANEFISDNTVQSTFQFTVKNDKLKDEAEVVLFKSLEYNSTVVSCSHKYELQGRDRVKIFINLAPGKEQKIDLKTRVVRG